MRSRRAARRRGPAPATGGAGAPRPVMIPRTVPAAGRPREELLPAGFLRYQSAMQAPDPWGERLPRKLGLASTVAVLVGSTIGSGIFRTPAVIAGHIDDLALFIGAWVAGGLVALAGALTVA